MKDRSLALFLLLSHSRAEDNDRRRGGGGGGGGVADRGLGHLEQHTRPHHGLRKLLVALREQHDSSSSGQHRLLPGRMSSLGPSSMAVQGDSRWKLLLRRETLVGR